MDEDKQPLELIRKKFSAYKIEHTFCKSDHYGYFLSGARCISSDEIELTTYIAGYQYNITISEAGVPYKTSLWCRVLRSETDDDGYPEDNSSVNVLSRTLPPTITEPLMIIKWIFEQIIEWQEYKITVHKRDLESLLRRLQ